MGMYDNVALKHTNPVTGEEETVFQSKSGPCQFCTMTPKELVGYARANDYNGADGVCFYDYYYGENGDQYKEEYVYSESDKGWNHTLVLDEGGNYYRRFYQNVRDGKPEGDNPYKLKYLIDGWIDEKDLWSEKEVFMQEMSDKWDAEHSTE